MRGFIKRLFIFCCLPLPILFALQYIINTGLQTSRHELYAEWNDIFDGKINSEILILGSSRAVNHYSSVILENKLNHSVYNIGIEGYRFPMQYERFRIYLKYNKKPKVILQNLESFMFERNTELFNSTQFLPYLDDPDIQRATRNYKGEFGLASRFPLYRYNGNWKYAAQGLLNYFGLGTNTSPKVKGYYGVEGNWDGSFDKYKKQHQSGIVQPINPEVEKEFIEFLSLCQSQEIKLVLIYSPEYIEMQKLTLNRGEIIERFKELAVHFNAVFLDYSDSQISYDRQYFSNSQHMNKKGAELFSNILADDLAREIIAQELF